MTRPLLLLILAVLLAACSSANTGVPARPTAAVANCIATPESATAIAEGLTVQGGGTLRDAFAEELGFVSGFVVAAEIDGPGMEGDGEVGTWSVGELGGGPIVAANSIAQEFSDWGAAAAEGSSADQARDAVANSAEASAAEDCVRGVP